MKINQQNPTFSPTILSKLLHSGKEPTADRQAKQDEFISSEPKKASVDKKKNPTPIYWLFAGGFLLCLIPGCIAAFKNREATAKYMPDWLADLAENLVFFIEWVIL
jgi:hypothetical protein